MIYGETGILEPPGQENVHVGNSIYELRRVVYIEPAGSSRAHMASRVYWNTLPPMPRLLIFGCRLTVDPGRLFDLGLSWTMQSRSNSDYD